MAKSATVEDVLFVFRGVLILHVFDGMVQFFQAIKIRTHYTIRELWQNLMIMLSLVRILRQRIR